MVFFYKIGVYIYYFGILITSLCNTKAKEWLKGRRNFFTNLKQDIDPNAFPIWIHCASLGEFEQGRPVIESLKKQYPRRKIIITFFSSSGYKIQKNYEYADWITYLPLDTKRNAKQFISTINPSFAIFIKYEFWYNYLKELYDNKIPVFLVSAIFRKNQINSIIPGKWYRKVLHLFSYIFVQDNISKQLLNDCELKQVTISGDTRFDRVQQISAETGENKKIEKFKDNAQLFIGGSTWPRDEQIIAKFINISEHSGLKYIIAPHEISETHIDSLTRSINKKVVRYSAANLYNIQQYNVLIIDNIGMLASLYKYGDLAYIGGGFGQGIHNILEPATFGLPILFGPNYHKFREAHQLIGRGGAFAFSNFEEFKQKMIYLLYSHENLSHAGEISQSFVKKRRGATDTILQFLNDSVLV